MHAILVATQEDAKISRQIAIQSRELSRDMKRDSVAMKTVSPPSLVWISRLMTPSADCSHHHVLLAGDILCGKFIPLFCSQLSLNLHRLS